jgi:SAM-dependent methyltransferase
MNNPKNLIDPWDRNAEARHRQILSGYDISFSKVLVPSVLGLIRSLKGYEYFTCLDVGCGSGVFTKILAENLATVKGIDPSENSIRIAQSYLSGVPNASIDCLGIEDFPSTRLQRYNLVVANMTLHVLQELDVALQIISDSMKTDGYFIFSVPHPCFYIEHKDGVRKRIMYQYNKPRYYEIPFTISLDQNMLPAKTPFFHRRIQDYSISLYNSNLSILKISEPFPDHHSMAQYPPTKQWEYPHFMIFLCQHGGL